ncbi:MAG: hypothetical protein NTW86_24260 [Candidatus Sumerlaeota bacterium]|nr:hypothetical protein [Candidatus Sumerlaeota bacterium]
MKRIRDVCMADGAASSDEANARIIETKRLRVAIAPEIATWSVQCRDTDGRSTGTVHSVHPVHSVHSVHPAFAIRDTPIDPRQYKVEYAERRIPDHKLGAVVEAALHYRKANAVEFDYRLLISEERPEVVAQLSFVNNTGAPLVVDGAATMAVPRATLGGNAGQWVALVDGKANNDPPRLLPVPDASDFGGWWFLALKNRETGRSLLLGNLTNNKGLGRFLLAPDGADSMRLAACSDYESIVMPAGARIEGEQVVLHFGRKGTDTLERFGDLIARTYGVDLAKQHPINPDDPSLAWLFGALNSYGAGVVKGFEYHFDRAKYEKPYMDPDWKSASWKRLLELGLGPYGYQAQGKTRFAQRPSTPLARHYGQPDFWFKEAQQIAQEHPDWYIGGRIDFSDPAVAEFERRRAEDALRDPAPLMRYNWDFTNAWRRLPGQRDPFMTSADTYRAALGPWCEAARNRRGVAYGMVWMNVVGLNYGLCDVIHIGHDSDQGYYGEGCTFTQGLTRQISGRYFYNGRVWWNNPDSFHVYVGGLYSRNQGKVHASFCSLAGNMVHLAEPFGDEEIPEDRLEIIRRVAPTTQDVSKAVDVFEHSPARLWNMPIRRAFGQWNIAGLFNVDFAQDGQPITQTIRFADLDLSPDKEYLVYEFWSRRFLGALKGEFTRTLQAPDCEIYSIVEKPDHPTLISTSRHVRQMAYEIRDLQWDASTRALRGASKVVGGDPYQLRVFVPRGYTWTAAEAEGLDVKTSVNGPLLEANFAAPESRDVRCL